MHIAKGACSGIVDLGGKCEQAIHRVFEHKTALGMKIDRRRLRECCRTEDELSQQDHDECDLQQCSMQILRTMLLAFRFVLHAA